MIALLKKRFGLTIEGKRIITPISTKQKENLQNLAKLLFSDKKLYRYAAILLLKDHLKSSFRRAEKGIQMMEDYCILGSHGNLVFLNPGI